MKPARYLAVGLLPLILCGCLEVEQHPSWVRGEYNGKPDNQPQQTSFHGDRLAWNAAITDRNYRQNEYRRAKP
ncbi:hypothetical protein [Noviherbaspirillum massiliense]|uniref:hypothetical protein n=1 Tax=Noviherbaspirillum massiliense TaxID=1465823 RepID=UPI00031DDCE6|nr:hypothetical protein [Noviherbaspirillum massiliense]